MDECLNIEGSSPQEVKETAINPVFLLSSSKTAQLVVHVYENFLFRFTTKACNQTTGLTAPNIEECISIYVTGTSELDDPSENQQH